MSKLSIVGIFIIAFICIYALNRFSRGASGNGTVTTESRTITPFTKLKLDGVFKTIITQNDSDESVKVETDKNLQNVVIVKNNGETLEISTKPGLNFNNATRMIVYVNVKDISSIETSSVGSIENKGTLKSPSLYLKTDAVGKTTLHINTAKLTADLNSVGAIDLSGSANNVKVDNNSVGKLEAYHLWTDTFTLKNNAVGAAEIYADKVFDIDHNGVGAVHYKGTGTVARLSDNGVGKVSKAD